MSNNDENKFNKDIEEINNGMSEITIINHEEVEKVSTEQISVDTSALVKSDLEEEHEQCIKEYYNGNKGLLDKLQKEGKTTYEGLMNGVMEEMYKSVDTLKGNELVAKKRNDLGASTLIETKHMEAMTQLSKVIQQKQIFDRENGIDLDSPQMVTILQYFMGKIKESFESLATDEEAQSLFFGAFATKVETWKKDIQELIDNMKVDIQGD